jgi:hypothetical protein
MLKLSNIHRFFYKEHVQASSYFFSKRRTYWSYNDATIVIVADQSKLALIAFSKTNIFIGT